MEPFHAKMVAAATGSTLTALTSALASFATLSDIYSAHIYALVTPFDVVKTRLQTQPPKAPEPLFPRPPANVCCQPPGTSVGCVRQMSSLARALPNEVVCIWDGAAFRTERVNGFADAVRHVWRAEGIRGLWKGTGTTL
jgi:solute carrier family 25, member 39/40